MCGICGKINFSDEKVCPDLLWAMTHQLNHRGPDQANIYCQENIGLGHTRLKIIDLSDAAKQPMLSEDGKIILVFNGEIYNYLVLRQNLEQTGYRFFSHSDTEVIIALYQKYGVGLLEHLRGMFAFAIWDESKKLFFAARDRLGKKPFCYYWDHKNFLFASEIKAILQDKELVARRVHLEAIHHYLSLQYVPHPHTAFDKIYKLPPAHYLTIHHQKLEISRYWKPSFASSFRTTKDDEFRILDKLDESVNLRRISDVPLGAFLSGGVDSSAIVALMSRQSEQPVQTFSIGFPHKDYNELDFAQQVADLFRTTHQSQIVAADAWEILPKLVWHYNEPFADSSAIPCYYLSALTRKNVTVALAGDGGDEVFAGYRRYLASLYSEKFGFLSSIMTNRFLERILLYWGKNRDAKSLANQARRFCNQVNKPLPERYLAWIGHFDHQQKQKLYTPALQEKTADWRSDQILANYINESDGNNIVEKLLYCDLMTYLPGDLLVKTDIASMANSLEVRAPFLDHEFVEMAMSLPLKAKIRRGEKKYILKKACEPLLPKNILYRSKMGFGVPIGNWIRNQWQDLVRDLLLSQKATTRGYFQTTEIERILDKHMSGVEDWQYQIWNLIMLELWHREFIDS